MATRRRAAAPRATQPMALDRFLRRAGVRRWLSAVAVLLLLAAFLFADRQGWLLHETQEWGRYDGMMVRVVRVIDGDTLDVEIADSGRPHTRVRFWGIDAPETAKPHQGTESQHLADDAWRYTRQLCEGKMITLRLDVRQYRDRYDRLLAYIELPGGAVVNEMLLLEGLARFESRFPHRHLERYEMLERQAKFEKKGLWAPGK